MSSRSQIDSVQTLFKNEKNTPQSTEKRGHMAIVANTPTEPMQKHSGWCFLRPATADLSEQGLGLLGGGGGLKRQALKRSIHTEGDEWIEVPHEKNNVYFEQ